MYAEGQRRYVESLSSYARQFLDQMEKPDVDAIEGLSPAIAIQQKTTSNNPRSTVATVTEIYDYLRLLYARAGTPACPSCGKAVHAQSAQDIVDSLLKRPEKTRVIVLSPVVRGEKGAHDQLLRELIKDGFTRVRVDGDIVDLDESVKLDKRKRHDLDIVVDRIVVRASARPRINDSIELALKRSGGLATLLFPETGEETLASERFACLECGISLPELEPRLFSFNSPHGACPSCSGLGEVPYFDPGLVVPNPELSLADGAIAPWNSKGTWYRPVLEAVARHYRQSTAKPWKKLPSKFRDVVLHGSGDEPIEVVFDGDDREYRYKRPFEGVIGNLDRRLKETNSDNVRAAMDEYQAVAACVSCKGSRLRSEANVVRIADRTIGEVVAMPIGEALAFFEGLELPGTQADIALPILRELRSRLRFLESVGLSYLALERRAGTLSGGEAQRIRLATQIGSALMGVLYVLDEPSIGLHPRDNQRLIGTLQALKDLGNSVLVVEHDEETMRAADWLIDMGPGAGKHGGTVVAEGAPKAIADDPNSLTGQYLSGMRS
ncbi:MAG: excinuclease ABC subunit UvrA, partial [Myxococcota bacterium]